MVLNSSDPVRGFELLEQMHLSPILFPLTENETPISGIESLKILQK